MGHVAAKGYLSPNTVAEFDDLKAWLKKYDDYPEAKRIHALAERKNPKRAGELADPDRRIIRGNSDEADWVAPDYASADAEAGAKKLKSLISSGSLKAATAYLNGAELKAKLPRADYGRLAHQVAAGQYYLGDSATALALADSVAADVRGEVPEADWIAGLAAFRLEKYDVAAAHFAAMADNPATTSWLKSAAGFWAARSFLIAKQPQQVSRMLEIAASKPRTFYGLIALKILGREAPFAWNEPRLEKSAFQRLVKVSGIARGVALYQVGEMEAAEGAIARAHGRLNPELDRPFIGLAHEMGFAHVQLQAAHAAKDADLKAAAYPVMSFKPSDGWQVDPALVHAIVRQESKFEMRVTSSADARGLMQLMPATAAGTMKDTTLDNPGTKAKLFEPSFNLSIGQKYVQKMHAFVEPDGNLFQLVVAYNGGPGNLQKWLKEVEHRGDPLLFVESIPSRETRGYVERVIANYWIYQDRLGEAKTTLDQVARGEWPVIKWSDRPQVAQVSR
jgi:soluble lytic murein transglycosylase-like protein